MQHDLPASGVLFSWLPLLMLLALAGCQPAVDAPDVLDIEDLAERYAAAWSSGDPAHFASFYAENGVLQINDGEPSIGRAAIEATAKSFMGDFPDMLVELVEVRREGERVIFEWHWTGTNTGPGGTGAAVDLYGYESWSLDEDGLIVESLGHMDEDEYARQLGAGSSE
ncbi:MAG: nuclear transport factor 2 family protein [Woeseiaceae bacterium]|nr:nuclear transport factor 2 family protein [Woeseiaceae bacterium]